MQIDATYLKQCHNGNRTYQKLLYEYCYNYMYPIGNRYLQNSGDIETVLNDSFLKILKQHKRCKSPDHFVPWTKRIMINACIDFLRKNKALIDDLAKANHIQMINSVDWNKTQEKQILESLLKALPSMTNKVFNLFAIDGYSHQEISKLLGMSEGTSKWHVHEARKKLKVSFIEFKNAQKKMVKYGS